MTQHTMETVTSFAEQKIETRSETCMATVALSSLRNSYSPIGHPIENFQVSLLSIDPSTTVLVGE